MMPELKNKKRNNTNQFEENMPNVEHNSVGEEKRNAWKKKFSRIIGMFHSGSTFKRVVEGPNKVTCEIWRSGKLMARAEGFRVGRWSAEGNAKRNALRALKKLLGRKYDLTDRYEIKYV